MCEVHHLVANFGNDRKANFQHGVQGVDGTAALSAAPREKGRKEEGKTKLLLNTRFSFPEQRAGCDSLKLQ